MTQTLSCLQYFNILNDLMKVLVIDRVYYLFSCIHSKKSMLNSDCKGFGFGFPKSIHFFININSLACLKYGFSDFACFDGLSETNLKHNSHQIKPRIIWF